ncbi:MAG: glycosyltransferase [Verrucomicrobia bacterium]|nr:glycosyltransferase [Verrucomicrobiota bacterium]
MPSRLSILYVGPMVAGSTTMQRAQAFRDLGHQLTCVTTEAVTQAVVKPSLFSRLRRKITGPQDQVKANVGILQAMQTQPFDLLWIDKGLTIQAKTLALARIYQPRCRIVGFSPDDMMNPVNQSRHFLKGLPHYDFYISNKSYNVAELQGLGCPKVLFMENAYDPHTHRPLPVGEAERKRLGGVVGFVGQWEPERAESLRKLALAGISVRVWGYTWERMKNVPPNLMLENKPLWGDEYAQALRAFDINLCFLRKCNRDLQTTRSIEIPACGGFMLAERTCEHSQLFVEGQEADFFSDDEELLGKVRHYLDNPPERHRIAEWGLKRCLRDKYSYSERIQHLLTKIFSHDIRTAN